MAGPAQALAPPPAFWVCCRFTALPGEVVARELIDSTTDPVGGQRPWVLVDAATQPKRYVVAACPRASAAGVRPGMPLTTALGYCPELLCRARRPDIEQARLATLADIAYGITPNVSLLAPDSLLLECAGSLKLFAGAARMLERLRHTWQALAHHCDLAIAHTPLAATVLARAQQRFGPECSDDRHALITRTQQALAALPLGLLWDASLVEALQASGLYTLGAVQAVPRTALGRRFGERVLQDLDRLTGARADPRPYVVPAARFRSSAVLLEPLRQRDGLVFPLHRLLRDLVVWLRARQRLVHAIQWRIGAEGRPSETDVRIDIRLGAPSADDKRLLALSELQLDRVALPEAIERVELRASRFANLAEQATTRSLFGAASAATGTAANATAGAVRSPAEFVDLLRARLGADALHGIALANDHRPELAWRAVEPAASSATARANSLAKALPATAAWFPAAPLWLIDPPRPLGNERFELLRGPHRIEAGWWDLASPLGPIARDYYLARNLAPDAAGALWWIFRRHDDDAWFLHGLFA